MSATHREKMDDRWSLESVTALVTGGSLRVWFVLISTL
ncbi:unnamed protein product [Brassica oleracea var. botrytis]